ncbi:MAG: 50S ribosome-binding GTPase [bacterium]
MTQRPSRKEVFPPEIARYIDLAAYVLDARAPSACLWLDDKLAGRECFVLSRADLADPRATAKWLAYFAAHGYPAFALDSIKGEGVEEFMRHLTEVFAAKAKERARRGIQKTTLRIVALGIPNTGKSTFLNAIIGRRRMRTGNRPGITRGHQWVRVMDGVDLLDTPGIIRETAHFKRVRATWLALNLLPMDETLLEPAVSGIIAALPPRARTKFEKLYGMEMPWEDEAEAIAVKVAAIKRLYLGKGVPDLSRSYRLILRDFQQGKLGRISLETPASNPVASPVFAAR